MPRATPLLLAHADAVAAPPALAVDELPSVMGSHSGAKALLIRSLDPAVSSWVVHETDSLATLTTCPVRAQARKPSNIWAPAERHKPRSPPESSEIPQSPRPLSHVAEPRYVLRFLVALRPRLDDAWPPAPGCRTRLRAGCVNLPWHFRSKVRDEAGFGRRKGRRRQVEPSTRANRAPRPWVPETTAIRRLHLT